MARRSPGVAGERESECRRRNSPSDIPTMRRCRHDCRRRQMRHYASASAAAGSRIGWRKCKRRPHGRGNWHCLRGGFLRHLGFSSGCARAARRLWRLIPRIGRRPSYKLLLTGPVTLPRQASERARVPKDRRKNYGWGLARARDDRDHPSLVRRVSRDEGSAR